MKRLIIIIINKDPSARKMIQQINRLFSIKSGDPERYKVRE